MSVVIKGMSMPISCWMCRIDKEKLCHEWKKLSKVEFVSQKPYTCPILCELPEKHGRLIDVSELLTVTNIKEDGTELTYIPYSEVEEAQTIIEAE